VSWQVVGCSTCNGHWLTEDLHTKETAECPLCYTDHPASTLSVKFEHDSREVAAEIRSRILAEQAGELDAYDAMDDYGVLGDRAQQRHREREQLLADKADAVFEGWYSLYEDDAERVFEERDRRLEDEARNALSHLHDRFADEAERVFEAGHPVRG